MKTLLYVAAHSGFDLGQVPLGGGAAICHNLREEWSRTKPFEVKMIGPEVLGATSPHYKDLVQYSELSYARFCRSFERKATEEILKHDPRQCVVLSNDISEGPDFQLLGRQGYKVFTIYHVDVVDYFSRIYLKSFFKPETTTAVFRQLERMYLAWLVPDVLKLVWQKQQATVRFSSGLIVPSQRMKSVLLACYPELHSEDVHVIPWGAKAPVGSEEDIQRALIHAREQYGLNDQAPTLLMLSRISPEKGQHRLLEALALWETQFDFPPAGINVLLSGEAAYMMGKKYEKKLKRLAGKLKKSRVHFVGYANEARKRVLFRAADLYVFPSVHESYGLTMLEALREGLPVLTTYTHGACEVFQPEFGHMLSETSEEHMPELMMQSLRNLLSDKPWLKRMGEAGAAWAKRHEFSGAASRLAALLASQ